MLFLDLFHLHFDLILSDCLKAAHTDRIPSPVHIEFSGKRWERELWHLVRPPTRNHKCNRRIRLLTSRHCGTFFSSGEKAIFLSFVAPNPNVANSRQSLGLVTLRTFVAMIHHRVVRPQKVVAARARPTATQCVHTLTGCR